MTEPRFSDHDRLFQQDVISDQEIYDLIRGLGLSLNWPYRVQDLATNKIDITIKANAPLEVYVRLRDLLAEARETGNGDSPPGQLLHDHERL